ncbi:uncharacterized protein LOC122083137 isoform X2 [Macadamia integrifolia]|uniref:uncharacterized protein LOC122083137 isoform X2 n=1 Tax=Macadamia integrifolia TaxID=60698 RepID=UPI001C4E879C|nr:uncharacterized protein LOC122083137 isoform X2 [Macadamia integrifolia]
MVAATAAAATATLHQLFHSSTRCTSNVRSSSQLPWYNSCSMLLFSRDRDHCNQFCKLNGEISGHHRILGVVCKAASEEGNIVEADKDGVSLGTMILPMETDIPRFETLLFQWANSLCQGANLPLPVPLKISSVLCEVAPDQIQETAGDWASRQRIASPFCISVLSF